MKPKKPILLFLFSIFVVVGCTDTKTDVTYLKYLAVEHDDSEPTVLDSCLLRGSQAMTAIVVVRSRDGLFRGDLKCPEYQRRSSYYTFDATVLHDLSGNAGTDVTLQMGLQDSHLYISQPGDTLLVSARLFDDAYYVIKGIAVEETENPADLATGSSDANIVDLPNTVEALRDEITKKPTTCDDYPPFEWSEEEWKEWMTMAEDPCSP